MREKYSINELVTVAYRENNSKRPYLYVNPIQGKHVPVAPEKSLQLFRYMAGMIDMQYPGEKILLIAFAETATAVGAGIAFYSSSVKYCTQTTREKYKGASYLYFTEEHSHATDQFLIINGYEKILNNVDRILFVDDEVTTGNTICHLMEKIKEKYFNYKGSFSIISILNSMTDERLKQMLDMYRTECLYVCRIPHEYGVSKMRTFGLITENRAIQDILECKKDKLKESEDSFPAKQIVYANSVNFRYLQETTSWVKDTNYYLEKFFDSFSCRKNFRDVLVLGTEEFMFLPMKIAEAIHKRFPQTVVKFHATTRSPIKTSELEGYPLYNRSSLISMYDSKRITYLYNLKGYDLVVVLTDACLTMGSAYSRLEEVLRQTGCKFFYLVCPKE